MVKCPGKEVFYLKKRSWLFVLLGVLAVAAAVAAFLYRRALCADAGKEKEAAPVNEPEPPLQAEEPGEAAPAGETAA